jgi:hypothetical protein
MNMGRSTSSSAWEGRGMVDRHTIIALDPGGTTGIAQADIEDFTITKIGCGQDRDMASGLYEVLRSFNPDYIVCETFQFRNASRPGLDLTSAKLIGVCELYAERHGIFLKMQEPSVQGPRAYWTDAKLKAAGLYLPGKEHSRSAMKHLLYFLTFKKGSTLWHDAENHFLRHYAQQM